MIEFPLLLLLSGIRLFGVIPPVLDLVQREELRVLVRIDTRELERIVVKYGTIVVL